MIDDNISLKINNLEKINKKKMIPTIREAIDFISDAWDSVTERTMKNCWLYTKILPVENEMMRSRFFHTKNQLTKDIFKLEKVLDQLKNKFNVNM